MIKLSRAAKNTLEHLIVILLFELKINTCCLLPSGSAAIHPDQSPPYRANNLWLLRRDWMIVPLLFSQARKKGYAELLA
jgi:hypothetical protein